MQQRSLEPPILEDLSRKMVFLAGPRQVGKTTLAQLILKKRGLGAYYLWDNAEDRRVLLKGQWPSDAETIVLDELHKYARWKTWIKGEYDKHHDRLSFMVTGSARLDVYRRGGDSLQGRYHHYRLHPFSLREMEGLPPAPEPMKDLSFTEPSAHHAGQLQSLMEFGGFPEPLLAADAKTLRRWRKERLERFFREDVRDLEHVRELSLLQILADLLPAKVGSPLSLNSLREDLEVSHRAVSHWLDILERLYFVFRIRPFMARSIRSLKKEPKLYLWDWSMIEDPGDRFENLVASHLLKLCHWLEDTQGYQTGLHYLRDAAKREVDFLVTVDRKPWFAVEAKLSDETPANALRYFGDRLKIPRLYQVVFNGRRDFLADGVRVMPAAKFLLGLA